MEPDGMKKVWTTNVRSRTAKTTATTTTMTASRSQRVERRRLAGARRSAARRSRGRREAARRRAASVYVGPSGRRLVDGERRVVGFGRHRRAG